MASDVHQFAEAGGTSLVLLTQHGDVLRWGGELECGDNAVPPPSDLIASGPLRFLVAGERHAMAVRGDGTSAIWGCNEQGQLSLPPELALPGAVIVDLAAGANHTIALLESGRVVCWGDASLPSQADPTMGHAGVLVGAMGDRSFVLRTDRSLVHWSNSGEATVWSPGEYPGLEEDLVQLVCAEIQGQFSILGLKADGDLVFEASDSWADPLDPFEKITGGDRFRGLRRSGHVIDFTAAPGDVQPGAGGVPGRFATDIAGGWRFLAMVPVPEDCDDDGVVDVQQIASDPSIDCDRDGRLDVCEDDPGLDRDCNGNGLADACEILAGGAADVDGDLVPDACQPDCDGDAIPDAYAIVSGIVEDCDRDAVPDECVAVSDDLNGNGRPDVCDVAFGDLDLDGCIGGGDLGRLLIVWGAFGDVPGNLDFDGRGWFSNAVDGADLGLLLKRWGQCP